MRRIVSSMEETDRVGLLVFGHRVTLRRGEDVPNDRWKQKPRAGRRPRGAPGGQRL